MPAPYSEDLRQKAITAVERGERKTDVSRMLNISRNTLDLWLKRKEQTGNCQPLPAINRVVDIKLGSGNGFVSLPKSMGARPKGKWRALWGDNVTQQNMSDALRKLGLSRKKRPTGIENGMLSSVKSSRND